MQKCHINNDTLSASAYASEDETDQFFRFSKLF